jgi:hypothetical protein
MDFITLAMDALVGLQAVAQGQGDRLDVSHFRGAHAGVSWVAAV